MVNGSKDERERGPGKDEPRCIQQEPGGSFKEAEEPLKLRAVEEQRAESVTLWTRERFTRWRSEERRAGLRRGEPVRAVEEQRAGAWMAGVETWWFEGSKANFMDDDGTPFLE